MSCLSAAKSYTVHCLFTSGLLAAPLSGEGHRAIAHYDRQTPEYAGNDMTVPVETTRLQPSAIYIMLRNKLPFVFPINESVSRKKTENVDRPVGLQQCKESRSRKSPQLKILRALKTNNVDTFNFILKKKSPVVTLATEPEP